MEKKQLDPESKQEESALVRSLRNKIAELDTVLANMPGHVYWIDHKGVYLGCNESQADFLRFSSREEIVGKHSSDIVPKDLAEILDQTNAKVMEEGVMYVGEEASEIPGHEGIYLSQKAPLKNKEGEVIGMLGVSIDITDRKRMERELQEAKEVAELANQTKTEFIRNIEHDIRTPLCGIMSVATYLNSIEKDFKKKEFLNDLEIATNELLNYLDNIVEFSQINTGVVPLILKEFNLEEMLKSILKLEYAAAKHKGLELIISYSDEAPKIVIGDRFRLHRIVLNLVNNAIKFTQHGHVKVAVKVLKVQPKEVLLEIAIEDTGIGIDKKHHEFIYDKFTRCDPSNKGLYKGTGLGLWIVRQFISDLQGEIKLESEVGKGSVFICCFPFKLA